MKAWEAIPARQFIELLPTPAIVIDAQGMIEHGNAGAADLFEHTLPFEDVNIETLLTQPERARLSPLNWLEKWADRPDAPELNYVYLTCVSSSGHEKPLSVRVARVASQPASYLVTMHDLSHWHGRFMTERSAHRVAARLLSITADGAIITDQEQMITYANASSERIFGYAQGELLGKPLETLIPADVHKKHQQHIKAFMQENRASRLMNQRQNVTGVTAQGEQIPIEVSITRLNVEGSAVFCALVRTARGAQE